MQSLKGQDLGLSQVEELRLSLAAAAREVADLQQQAALAAAGIEGPLAAALEMACRDARQWAEAAETRVDAAKEEEQGLRQQALQLRQRALANRTAVAEGLQQVLHAYEQPAEQEQSDIELWDEVETSGQQMVLVPAHGSDVLGAAAALPVAGRPADSVTGALGQQRSSEPLSSAAQQEQPRQQQGQQRQQRQLDRQQHRQQDSPMNGTVSRGGSLWDQYQAQQQQQQQQQQSLPGPAAKPPTRTASDILAAYRARQQGNKAASEGRQGGLGSRGSSDSQEAAAGDEMSAEAAGSTQAGAAGALGLRQGSTPLTQAAEVVAGPRGIVAADGDSYYVSDLTSDDSSRF
jgi:hypothetical protein